MLILGLRGNSLSRMVGCSLEGTAINVSIGKSPHKQRNFSNFALKSVDSNTLIYTRSVTALPVQFLTGLYKASNKSSRIYSANFEEQR